MLTKPRENGIVRYLQAVLSKLELLQEMCSEYWPNKSAGPLQFGDYIVELLDAKEFKDYTKREFKLTLQTVRQTCVVIVLYM